MVLLPLMGLALGCTGSEPTRTVVITAAPIPTTQATATSVPPTAVATASPSTAAPAPEVTPTPQILPTLTDRTAVPAIAPTVDAGQRTEPTAGPITDTPVVRETITPAATETPQPTVTPAPTATPTSTPAPAPTPTSTPAPQAPAATVDVIIECIFFNGLVKTTEADEYVQVLNQGPGAVDLLGWRLID